MRYIKNDIKAIAVGGHPSGFGPRPNGVWVDCAGCGRRDRLAGEDTKHVSDARATRIFEEHGWTVLPTVCPECRKAA